MNQLDKTVLIKELLSLKLKRRKKFIKHFEALTEVLKEKHFNEYFFRSSAESQLISLKLKQTKDSVPRIKPALWKFFAEKNNVQHI
jgi:hypothetical protein